MSVRHTRRFYPACFSSRGASHIVKNQPMQDAGRVFQNERFTILAIADGHGGDEYDRSDVGSALLVDSAIDVLTEIFEAHAAECIADKNHAQVPVISSLLVKNLFRHIRDVWRLRVLAHSKYIDPHCLVDVSDDMLSEEGTEPDTDSINFIQRRLEQKALFTRYGTTLLCAVIYGKSVYCLQLGDGLIIIHDTTGIRPVFEDLKVTNSTDSIINDDCDSRVRFAHLKNGALTMALYLLTDGVTDAHEYDKLALSFRRGAVDVMNKDVKDIYDYFAKINTLVAKSAFVSPADDSTIAVAVLANTNVES
jgi:serine/threonine protein phosphatase PrpC